MRNILYISFTLLLIVNLSRAQEFNSFSDLHSTSANLFNSVTSDDGIIFFINEAPSNKLVKLDWSGQIVKEVILPFMDSLYYNGQLAKGDEYYYLIGLQRLYPNGQGTNNDEIWKSQKRSIIEFDDNLEILEILTFDVIPLGAGENLISSGTYAGTIYPSTVEIIDNKISSTWTYSIFDTQTNPPVIIGELVQMETLDLSTSLLTTHVLDNVGLLLDALYLEDHFYVYGDISDTIVNGISFNSTPVALYSYEGEKLQNLSFDDFGSGGFSDGSMGTLHKGRIYSTYYGRSVNSDGCIEDNAVIDVRDTEFNLINRVKLPDCEFFPFGKNSFVFTSDDALYFSAVDFEGIGLYKFDLDLNLICSEIVTLPNERPAGLTITPNDKVIIETLYNLTELRLYEFVCDKLSSNGINMELDGWHTTFYPNPTSGLLYSESISSDHDIEIYSFEGVFQSNYSISHNALDLTLLKSGVYLVKIFDRNTREIVWIERIVKI